MKKLLLLGFLTLLFTALICDDADAQSRKKKKKKSSTKKEKTDEYFDESGFANKLWYGGNFVLGYAGGEFESQFAFGITPMVGYKILGDYVSMGPRIGFIYNHYRLKVSNTTVIKASPLSYTAGWFARLKPAPNLLPNFFGHFEYEYENAGLVYVDGSGQTDIERVSYNNAYIGAGYNSGGLMGYEILVLYNANHPDNSAASPFDIRFGFTYKF